MKRVLAVTAATVVGVGMLSACSTDAEPSSTTSTKSGISAITPAPTGTSTITITSVPLTPSTSSAADVDPAAYGVDGSPGYYHWSYATNPLRECSLSPAMNGLASRITCSVPYPPDAADISANGFSGPPNAIVLTTEGTEPTIIEGGPTPAPTLPANSRISFGDLACTALPSNAISCTSPAGWFTVQGGTLTSS